MKDQTVGLYRDGVKFADIPTTQVKVEEDQYKEHTFHHHFEGIQFRKWWQFWKPKYTKVTYYIEISQID